MSMVLTGNKMTNKDGPCLAVGPTFHVMGRIFKLGRPLHY
jgi:hypothetical protein